MPHIPQIAQTPWSKVLLRKPCGLFTFFCYFLNLVLGIALIGQASTYTKAISNDSNILCVSKAIFLWSSLVPIIWSFILLILGSLVVSISKRKSISRKTMFLCILFGLTSIVIGSLSILFIPLSNESEMIVLQDSQGIMYQYEFDGQRKQAFPILFTYKDIQRLNPNTTCTPFRIADVCLTSGSLLHSNVSKVFKCEPSSDEGLAFLESHLAPFSNYSLSAFHIGIAFLLFFGYNLSMTMYRRFVSPNEWCDNRLWPACSGGRAEETPLDIVQIEMEHEFK